MLFICLGPLTLLTFNHLGFSIQFYCHCVSLYPIPEDSNARDPLSFCTQFEMTQSAPGYPNIPTAHSPYVPLCSLTCVHYEDTLTGGSSCQCCWRWTQRHGPEMRQSLSSPQCPSPGGSLQWDWSIPFYDM